MESSDSCRSLLAVKSVGQHYAPTHDVLGLLEVFRRMVNESIRIGLANGVSSLRRLSLLSYNQLAHYDSPSYYKLCAISRAAGILAARKKSLRRGFATRTPYSVRQQFVSLRLHDEEWTARDSSIKREASEHAPDQAHDKPHLSTRGRGALFHSHPEQGLPLYRPRRCHGRVHVHSGRGP